MLPRPDGADSLAIAWIRPLAQPYLRGYRPLAQKNSLCGYWFLHSRSARPAAATAAHPAFGFFVGYLTGAEGFAYLKPSPPECLVSAFIAPIGNPLHRRLVADSDSLMRKTATYIRWLTHHPPPFALYDSESLALIRHLSMRDWPRHKYEHFSRNFYIETLAWLVRSALVRRLLAESLVPVPPMRKRP